MIDLFCIFTTGGLILWYKTFVGNKFENLLNMLIKNILLDEKRNQEFYAFNGSIMRWRIMNDAGIVYVVCYQESYNVLYVDQLLDVVVKDFTENYINNIKKLGKLYLDRPDYNDSFIQLLKKWEKYCQEKLENTKKNNSEYKRKKIEKIEPDSKETIKNDEEEIDEKKEDLIQFNPNIPRKKQANRSSAPSSKKENKNQPKVKEKRTWTDQYTEVNAKTIEKFDNSKKDKEDIVENKMNVFLGEADPDNLDDRSLDEILQSDDENKNNSSGGLFSKLTSKLKNFIGNKVLTKEDLDPIMKTFIDILMEKNVAKEIAENLCASVSKSLLKTKTQSFTTITSTVKEALKETISKILTPKQEFDILKQALASRKRGEPFKIVFIGVNGVGKSTNLAKVGYLLMNNGLKILIAACDNFRSGAIEQLKTHSRALGVDLFDKGYKDDPAYICKEAVEEAKRKGYDCVLIDTAGRMQDNEPLMKSLSKLVEINQPDVILFVGEALTGNDSVDQLKKFNQALIDYSKKEVPRTIDGILLTKFDTVDDKVGAALTMVYTTGKPIVFVGTGQKYTNLKKLNVNHVLNALFG